jgi:hypothetical protein
MMRIRGMISLNEREGPVTDDGRQSRHGLAAGLQHIFQPEATC